MEGVQNIAILFSDGVPTNDVESFLSSGFFLNTIIAASILKEVVNKIFLFPLNPYGIIFGTKPFLFVSKSAHILVCICFPVNALALLRFHRLLVLLQLQLVLHL